MLRPRHPQFVAERVSISSSSYAWRIEKSRGYRSLEQPSTVTPPPLRGLAPRGWPSGHLHESVFPHRTSARSQIALCPFGHKSLMRAFMRFEADATLVAAIG